MNKNREPYHIDRYYRMVYDRYCKDVEWHGFDVNKQLPKLIKCVSSNNKYHFLFRFDDGGSYDSFIFEIDQDTYYVTGRFFETFFNHFVGMMNKRYVFLEKYRSMRIRRFWDLHSIDGLHPFSDYYCLAEERQLRYEHRWYTENDG